MQQASIFKWSKFIFIFLVLVYQLPYDSSSRYLVEEQVHPTSTFKIFPICHKISRWGNTSCRWSLFIPLENIRKPLAFWWFKGVQKETCNITFSNVFGGYRKRPVAWTRLTIFEALESYINFFGTNIIFCTGCVTD